MQIDALNRSIRAAKPKHNQDPLTNRGMGDHTIAAPCTKAVGGGTAYLREVDIVAGSPRVRISLAADDDPDAAGPELTEAWEASAAALAFSDDEGQSLTIKGPAIRTALLLIQPNLTSGRQIIQPR